MRMISILKQILTHRFLALIFRLYIGGIFIYASMYKINHSAEFAETIASYQLIPYWTVNIMAAVLPWIELVSGILLASGIRVKSAAGIIGFLLFLFTLAIAISLLREMPINCGCFHTIGDTISGWTLIRDILWMTMTAHIFFFDKVFQLEKKFSFNIREIQE